MVWEPVLSHGAAAHYAVQHFFLGFFDLLSKGRDLEKFPVIWRDMAEYGLAADWNKKNGVWFYGLRILCDLLGFGREAALHSLPPGTALGMRDVYERWAASHLGQDEECVSRFCYFLASAFGAPLRLDGLRWIAAMFKLSTRSGKWYRDRTGDALIELLNTSLNQNASELAKDTAARQALVELAADLADRGLPTALALQERIKLLR